MYAAFAAIYAGLASLLAGNNTATILAVSLSLAVLSSAALGHFAATHVFAPLIGHTSQAFMIGSIGVSIALQEIMRLQGGARDLWMMRCLWRGIPDFRRKLSGAIGISDHCRCDCIYGYWHSFFIMQFTAAGRYWKACSQSERWQSSRVNTSLCCAGPCVGSATLASVSG